MEGAASQIQDGRCSKLEEMMFARSAFELPRAARCVA